MVTTGQEACTISAAEPIGTTSTEALACNSFTLDRLINGASLFYNNRVGAALSSFAGFTAQVNELLANTEGVPLGDGIYAVGREYTTIYQFLTQNNIQYRVRSTTTLPYTTTEANAADDDNLTPFTGVRDLRLLGVVENLLGVGSSLFPTDLDEAIADGTTVPSGTTHLMVNISSQPEIVSINPITTANGVITNITELGATIGVTDVVFETVPSGFRVQQTTFQQRFLGDILKDDLTVVDFGGVSGEDSTTAANNMIATLNRLTTPLGFNLVCANVVIPEDCVVKVDKATLTDAAATGSFILGNSVGASTEDIVIEINELDGNKANQSGTGNTHLLYFLNCPDIDISVNRAHGNYALRTSTPPNDRGAIYVGSSPRAKVRIERLDDWAREGMWLELCDDSYGYVRKATGTLDQEFSGIQMSGNRCILGDSSVENCGASGISFDVVKGQAGNLISRNSRFFNGVNFGHVGIPSTDSTVESIIVDGCGQDGVSIVSGTQGLVINSVNIDGAGRHGINQSDTAAGARINGGIVKNSTNFNINTFNAEISLSNMDISVGGTAGKFRRQGTGSIIHTNLRISTDPLNLQFVALDSQSVTLTNGNSTQDHLPIVYASNASGASAQPFISAVNDGSVVLGTVNVPSPGAGIRVDFT